MFVYNRDHQKEVVLCLPWNQFPKQISEETLDTNVK